MVVPAAKETDFPKVRFSNINDGDRLSAGSDLHVDLAVSDGDGIKELKIHLNGLLVDAGTQSDGSYVWNRSSDQELLRNLE